MPFKYEFIIDPMNEKQYFDDQFELNYQIKGDGLCLVLLHGYLDNLTFFDDFIHQLKGQYKTIAIDLPGHGLSKYLNTQTSIDDIAQAINQLLANEKIKSAVFIGHSMGGYVALAMAIKHPEMVQKLILVHSHPYADNELRVKSRQREIEYIKNGKYDLIKRAALLSRFQTTFIMANLLKIELVESSIDAIKPSDALQTLHILSTRKDYSLALSTSRIPTLFCLSPTDKHTDIKRVTDLTLKPDQINIAWFNQSLHMCHWEEPELFLETVIHFIQSHSS